LTFSVEMIESILAGGFLVATTNDLRRYPRFNPPQPTFSAWQSANQRYVSRVGNLGLGGLFIRTPEPPPLGTLIQLLLDTSEGEIRARAEVKSTRRKEGMGVKIVAMQQDDRARFARWLKRLSHPPNPG
jgi:PilZ domain-containing protein